jgi:hypothetical protein
MRVINHPAPVQTFIDQDGKAVETTWTWAQVQAFARARREACEAFDREFGISLHVFPLRPQP